MFSKQLVNVKIQSSIWPLNLQVRQAGNSTSGQYTTTNLAACKFFSLSSSYTTSHVYIFCFLHGVEASRNKKATKNISVLFTSFLKSKVIKISHKWQNQNILHSVQKTIVDMLTKCHHKEIILQQFGKITASESYL